MAKSGAKIVWLPAGVSNVFKNSEEIASALMTEGERIAQANSIAALNKLHSPVFVQPYVAELRQLRNTQVCVVHSTTRMVAAVGRKHGLPNK